MGKYTRVTCDVCCKDIIGSEYYTMAIRKVINGKQLRMPTVWVCRDCMLKTHILFAHPIQEQMEEV